MLRFESEFSVFSLDDFLEFLGEISEVFDYDLSGCLEMISQRNYSVELKRQLVLPHHLPLLPHLTIFQLMLHLLAKEAAQY